MFTQELNTAFDAILRKVIARRREDGMPEGDPVSDTDILNIEPLGETAAWIIGATEARRLGRDVELPGWFTAMAAEAAGSAGLAHAFAGMDPRSLMRMGGHFMELVEDHAVRTVELSDLGLAKMIQDRVSGVMFSIDFTNNVAQRRVRAAQLLDIAALTTAVALRLESQARDVAAFLRWQDSVVAPDGPATPIGPDVFGANDYEVAKIIVGGACKEAGIEAPRITFNFRTFGKLCLPKAKYGRYRAEAAGICRFTWRGDIYPSYVVAEATALAAAVLEIPAEVDAHFRSVERKMPAYATQQPEG